MPAPKPAPFKSLGLPAVILSKLDKLGFSQATAVQTGSIPPLMKGQSVVARAPTGSGKTLAYLLPALTLIDPDDHHPQVLILVPTRELASQVFEVAQSLDSGLRLGIACGGGRTRCPPSSHLIVATPGAMLQVLEDELSLRTVKLLVVDEADRLLEMGFREPLGRILEQTPRCPGAFLSATWPDDLRQIAKERLGKPVSVDAGAAPDRGKFEEWAFNAYPENHCTLTDAFLRSRRLVPALVFCNHRDRCDEVAETFREMGWRAASLHGELEQKSRENRLQAFRDGRLQMLVATDLASRGLDLPALPVVVNHDIPYDSPDYIHRAGRTARAGRTGVVVSFYNGKAVANIEELEKRSGRAMKKMSFNQAMLKFAPGGKVSPLPASARVGLAIGRAQKITPAMILGLLTSAGGIDGLDIGRIMIEARDSIIEMTPASAKTVSARLADAEFKGHPLKAKILGRLKSDES